MNSTHYLNSKQELIPVYLIAFVFLNLQHTQFLENQNIITEFYLKYNRLTNKKCIKLNDYKFSCSAVIDKLKLLNYSTLYVVENNTIIKIDYKLIFEFC